MEPAERLRRFLEDDAPRAPEAGFPRGTPAAIAEASAPPARTACPNPFLAEFVARRARPEGEPPAAPYRGSFRAVGRHPVAAFHPYPAKTPPPVIQALIEHYTRPGDLVLDAFCGSGMTGVAARACGRHALLCDLSPGATFVAGVNCTDHDPEALRAALDGVLSASEQVWGWLYATAGGVPLNYAVWSDVFRCPACAGEFCFFPHGVEHDGRKVTTRKAFPCPRCGDELNVRRVERILDAGLKRKRLVWVNAGRGPARENRAPDAFDRELAARAEATEPAAWYPRDPIDPAGYSARLAQLGDKGIREVSRLLSRRNLVVFADLWERVGRVEPVALRQACRAVLTSVFVVVSERQGYFGGGGGMSGNLYHPIVRMEKNVYATVRRKLRRLDAVEAAKAPGDSLPAGEVCLSTQSSTRLSQLPEACVDYVYVDPPFGANIIYSEMNLALEAWLGVRTRAEPEAVMDPARGRSAADYAALLRACFQELRRVLKPGHWMTVEFHNSRPGAWNAVQEAIGAAGFEVCEVGTLDKGSSTILGDIRPSAAKHDLLISARRPARAPQGAFCLAPPDPGAAWEDLRARLAELPLPAAGERVPERERHWLYDRMLAYHVARGQALQLSAAQVFAALRERFPEREGMHLLPEQAAAWDAARTQG